MSTALQPLDIRSGYSLVVAEREHQRDVNVDPFGYESFDRWNSLRRSWDFDHHVGAGYESTQSLGLSDSPFRIMGEIRGYL